MRYAELSWVNKHLANDNAVDTMSIQVDLVFHACFVSPLFTMLAGVIP